MKKSQNLPVKNCKSLSNGINNRVSLMEKLLLINNNQEDLIELIKSVNEENKIYERE